jgi:hypothetical protein
MRLHELEAVIETPRGGFVKRGWSDLLQRLGESGPCYCKGSSPKGCGVERSRDSILKDANGVMRSERKRQLKPFPSFLRNLSLFHN